MGIVILTMVGLFAIATGTLGSALGIVWATFRGRPPEDREDVQERAVAAGIGGAGLGAVAGFGNGPEFTWWGGDNIFMATCGMFLLAGLVVVAHLVAVGRGEP